MRFVQLINGVRIRLDCAETSQSGQSETVLESPSSGGHNMLHQHKRLPWIRRISKLSEFSVDSAWEEISWIESDQAQTHDRSTTGSDPAGDGTKTQTSSLVRASHVAIALRAARRVALGHEPRMGTQDWERRMSSPQRYRLTPMKKLNWRMSSVSSRATGTAKSNAIGAGPMAGTEIRKPAPNDTR